MLLERRATPAPFALPNDRCCRAEQLTAGSAQHPSRALARTGTCFDESCLFGAFLSHSAQAKEQQALLFPHRELSLNPQLTPSHPLTFSQHPELGSLGFVPEFLPPPQTTAASTASKKVALLVPSVALSGAGTGGWSTTLDPLRACGMTGIHPTPRFLATSSSFACSALEYQRA